MTINIRIEQDLDPESPRQWDNLGEIIAFHRRYNLGDKHDIDSGNFDGWDEMEDYLRRHYAVVLPLYLYDHSALTISTRPFSCPWDSGQVGFIVSSRDKILAEYGGKRLTKKTLELVEQVLEGEIRTYDQYLTGDVWGYVIEDEEGNLVDSCWGFFGREYAESEAEAAAKYYEQKEAA